MGTLLSCTFTMLAIAFFGFLIIRYNRRNDAKARANFEEFFGISPETSLAPDMIIKVYRETQDQLKALRDRDTDNLNLEQLSQHSAEIDVAAKRLKKITTIAQALGFTVSDEKE